jgi:hypothetical protein
MSRKPIVASSMSTLDNNSSGTWGRCISYLSTCSVVINLILRLTSFDTAHSHHSLDLHVIYLTCGLDGSEEILTRDQIAFTAVVSFEIYMWDAGADDPTHELGGSEEILTRDQMAFTAAVWFKTKTWDAGAEAPTRPDDPTHELGGSEEILTRDQMAFTAAVWFKTKTWDAGAEAPTRPDDLTHRLGGSEEILTRDQMIFTAADSKLKHEMREQKLLQGQMTSLTD